MTQPEAIGAADRLAVVMKDLSEKFEKMAEAQQHSRRMIRVIVISVTLDVLLSVGLIVFGLVASNAAHQTHVLAEANRATEAASCAASNRIRVDDILLWTKALATTHPANTAAEAAADAKFRDFIDKTFAPAVCVNT